MPQSFFRKTLALTAVGAVLAALLAGGAADRPAEASSHREAPLIIFDPGADNTDVYAFRSYEPGREGFVTLMANFIPFQEPSGGPHFYLFDPTVLYEIKIDNTGDGVEDVTYQFQFQTRFVNGDSVLGMAAPNEAAAGTGGIEPLITSLDDPDYNEPQTYTVRLMRGPTNGRVGGTVIGSGLIMPPSNIGERTTPNYEALAQQAIYNVGGGARVFAGQRDEGFYIDVGGVFDTLNLRNGGVSPTGGVDGLSGFNVNTIAFEAPVSALTRNGSTPTSTTDPNAVIGVWSTASRQTTRVIRPTVTVRGRTITLNAGPYRQVSRLGNPLVNEVVIPLRLKDTFNASTPANDAQFAPFVLDPQLARLISAVFGINVPGAGGSAITPATAFSAPPANRTDLVTIFATGIPAGTVPGAPNFTNFLSDGQPHEYQRLNVAVPPTPAGGRSRLGLLGGDLAGFPNGRRVFDDVTDIALRAVAGGTPFTPAFNMSPNNQLADGVSNNDVPYLERFPYLGVPHTGNTRAGKPHEHHVIDSQPPLP